MFDELDMLLASSISEKVVEIPLLELQEGERRIVSILFADVSGFTPLSEKLDPEQVRMIMDRLLQLFTICIKNYGGYIDKYEGDQVMALFGAKVASERDTERCLRAALEMLDKLVLFNDILRKNWHTDDLRLDIRIGVNSGLVTTGKIGEKREGDFTVYGEAVNLASRMEKYAPVNSIMVPGEVRYSALDSFEFQSNGSIEIKGVSKPVEVFLVKGVKNRDFLKKESWKSPFLGRDNEIELLSGRYGSLSEQVQEEGRKPSVTLIHGTAGLGKTRLIFEFVRRVVRLEDRLDILHASVPAFAQTPYCLFTEILSNYMGIRQVDPLAEVEWKFEEAINDLSSRISAECAARLNIAKPILGFLFGLNYEDERLQHDPRILKDHILLSVRHFIEATGESANRRGHPLTVILEDLQWIDEASSSMIDFLLKTLNLENRREGSSSARIMLIVSYRPEFNMPDSWHSAADLLELDLKPLTDEECEAILRSSIEDIDIVFNRKKELLTKSEGNPFYLEEWVKLLKSPDMKRDDIRTLPVPDSLTALLLSRIDRLEQDVRLLLQKASVNGMNFTSEVLEYIEKQLNRFEIIDDQLNQLNNSGFVNIVKDNMYSFNHAVTRDVSYNTLLITNRKILHRLIGEFIETKYAGRLSDMYPVLAYHFKHAAETEKAIRYLKKAIETAELNFDVSSAIGFYESLCSIYDGLRQNASGEAYRVYTHELTQNLIKRSNLLEPLGRWDECEELCAEALDLAERIEDRLLVANIRSNRGVINWRKGEIDEALSAISESVQEFEDLNDAEGITRATLNIGNIKLNQGNYDRAIECYRRVVDYFSEVNKNERNVALYTGNMGIAYMYKGLFKEAEECYSKQLEICERLGDRHSLATVTTNMGELYRNMGDLNKAMEYFNRASMIFEEVGDINRYGCALGNIGIIQYTRGDFESALISYQDAIEILKRIGNRFHSTLYTGNTAITYLHMKNHLEADKWFTAAIEETESMKSNHLLTYWLYYQAENYFHMGDYSRATEANERAAVIAREVGNVTTAAQCRILSSRIGFELLEDDCLRVKECIEPLLEMLSDTENIHDIAFINYELTKMFGRTGSQELSEEYRKRTVDICRELDQSEEDSRWGTIIRELEIHDAV